jgi:hypothetical protein
VNPLVDVDPDRYRAYAEFFVSASDVARAHRDDDGRPLGERYLPAALRGDAPFDMRTCAYKDSRRGRPMNVSALRGVSRHWPGVLIDVGVLRGAYLRRHAIDRFSWVDLWGFARTATAAPALLARRGREPREVVPARLAALFKPTIGLYMTSERAVLGGADPRARPDAVRFIELTERSGAFHSSDAVCSGPPGMVAEFLEAVLDGGPQAPSDGWLARLLDLDQLLRYGQAVARMELAKNLLFLELVEPRAGAAASRVLLKGVEVGGLELAAVKQALLGLLHATDVEFPERDAGAIDGWVDTFERLQSEVNAALGSRPTPRVRLRLHDLALMAEHLENGWQDGCRR